MKTSTINTDRSLYHEFCDHLRELESTKKLLIKSDFNQETNERLSYNETLQETKCPIRKPLIEMISESPAICQELKSSAAVLSDLATSISETDQNLSEESFPLKNTTDYDEKDVSII